MDRKMVDFIKEQYPPGTRIRLNSMEDPYAPVAPGTEGEVDFVDDIGTIHMKWDNGRALGIVPGEDSFSVLPPKLTTLEELDGLSDDVFEMLDFGKIGKALRTGENGTFTRSGYVVKHSELVTAPPCAKELPEKPEYLFRLTLGLHPDLEDDHTVTLELPASAEALREVQKQLGADGWEGAMVLDYDGIIPQAAEFADLPMELDAFNDFAEAVEAMPSREKQIPKLKALLEHFEVTDLATAAGLAEHIGDYILTPEISSPQEAAIDELNFTMDAHSAELLLPHVNLFTYGNEIIKDDNAALTSYGLLHREDYQPMQTPVQETQEQAMTME